MEGIQILRECPWISDCFPVKEHFDEYKRILDVANGMNPYNTEFDPKKSLREFFIMPDDVEGPLSSRSTPQYSQSRSVTNENDESEDKKNIEIGPENADDDDPFSLDKLESDCSIDLLTVEGELQPRELHSKTCAKAAGRITNWYAGAFMDGVIPDEGPEKLVTLALQAKELHKRATVKDYQRLRYRLLKYASTVRMVMKKETSPEDVPLKDDLSGSCLRDIIFNIRIHRPFHKRTYSTKSCSRFPKYSQELLMLGSQKLTELKDAIVCLNDHYIHEDLSENPHRGPTLSTLETSFPSSLFYFNGIFAVDLRNPNSIDISSTVRNWAKKHPRIGPMTGRRMDSVTLSELNVRLGYPYVYQHLGNCEHLVIITDIRLGKRTDIQEPSRYPLYRGNPILLSYKCYACHLYVAKWIIKDDPRLPVQWAHFCQHCLQSFFYDDKGKKIGNFKLYQFIDEFSAKFKQEEKKKEPTRYIEISIDGRTSPSHLVIEPMNE